MTTATKNGQQAVGALSVAVHDLRTTLPRSGEAVTVPIYRVIRGIAEDGTLVYSLKRLRDASFTPTAPSDLPARIAKVQVTGYDALTSFAEQSEAWGYRDSDLWNAALEAAEDLQLDGNQCRALSTHTALMLLARRGIVDVSPAELP